MAHMTLEDWDSIKFFTKEEFDCKETGENQMQLEFMRKLDELRLHCGFPFVITSGYRSPHHPEEVKKAIGGTHVRGIACDIKVGFGADRRTIVEKAIELGFNGIGVAHSFVHVDSRETIPVMWTYGDK